MNINIAILSRRQIKNENYISSTFWDETARDTNAHRGSQIKNSLKELIEDSFLNALSLPK
jgi:hypothetical protein